MQSAQEEHDTMAIEELSRVVPPPTNTIYTGDASQWAEIEHGLGIRLPQDYRQLCQVYGSGCFDDPGRLMVFVRNPFDPDYFHELECTCDQLRRERHDLRKEPNRPYGVFPHQPGWLPWGSDIDGSLLCWLTEGESEAWPVLLLSSDHTGFQQVYLPMTTFLARAFTRQIQTTLWHNPLFFAGPEPIRFVAGP
jgi:hypothetical protein